MTPTLEKKPLSRHLARLEAQSISILRDAAAEFRKPVMLYSIGKDSSVMLHLALKAFYPGKPPFPLLHIASGWDFRDMITHRDVTVARYGLDLIVHHNDQAAAAGVNPFTTDSREYTRLMLTESVVAALTAGGFDCAFGGGRRDEEKARAKERIFSVRGVGQTWEPRQQRPELWSMFNTRLSPGQSMRVFPLSDWTEIDIWDYIRTEAVPLVPLYFAKIRPTVTRKGQILVVDDERMQFLPGETISERLVRFRTLGCYPLTAAIESPAATVEEILHETLTATSSERQGRLIDADDAASMEKKKRQGYF